jgi:ribosomal protein S21
LAIGPINRSIKEERCVQVLVRDNNVDQALKVLKKKMQREGVFREMKLRGHYEKPSERRVREKAEAIRRARKLARKKLQREGLLPMKPRVLPGASGRDGPARTPRFWSLNNRNRHADKILGLNFFNGIVGPPSFVGFMTSKIRWRQRSKKCWKGEDPEIPLLDLSDAAVKQLIRSAKKRGYVTHDQINALLSVEEVKSEQVEDILAKFSEMGINLVETKDAEPEVATPEESEEEDENELVEVQQRPVPVRSEAKEPAERTDDPVRMYLREMGSVELLSREGEIAVAKRIFWERYCRLL